ncbi:hypothetical protein OPV22_015327 [Ensete ventricosum]|uniref:BHLH domain-containing protein n=1 Tax=Ensete ventricosum TaxID=4639 RepID=A0AAV8RDX0_ENSVE|nr:hypothetical protein OPV22_015327 [Ensete ventricosum]
MRSSHQEEERHGFSTVVTAPAFYDRQWNRSQTSNWNEMASDANGTVSSQRAFSLSHGHSPATSQTIHNLGFHGEDGFTYQLPVHQLHPTTITEFPDTSSFPKLNGFCKDFSSNDECQPHEKLFVRRTDTGRQTDGLQPLPGNLSENSWCDSHGGGRESFSMSFPTAYLSHSSPRLPFLSGSSDMDLLASARLGRSFCQTSFTGMVSVLSEDASSGFGHLPESIHGPFHHHHKMPTLASGAAEARTVNSGWEHKPLQTAPTKPRFEQHSSFSPFKVRKEKMGDRIAALQQLVAPFGKTDTASVLMEAIGYIKFLLDQVEKLSLPYMRSSGNKRPRTMQQASNEERDDMGKRDLRSRGLCLVPLSRTSYI